MLRTIGRELGNSTSWRASDSPPTGELADIFFETPDVHKWAHYFPVYEAVMGPHCSRPIRILEIGVFRGGSLEMWRKYLHPESTIVGLDIDSSCQQYDDPARSMHVRIGSQDDLQFLASVVRELGPFDVIIDDGSHRNGHMIDAFRYLFMNGLTDPGSYVVEDIHANYWTGWRDRPSSFVDFTKSLIDAMHAHYLNAEGETKYRIGHPERLTEISVPIVTTLVSKVEFFDSIAVIHRRRRDLPQCILRG